MVFHIVFKKRANVYHIFPRANSHNITRILRGTVMFGQTPVDLPQSNQCLLPPPSTTCDTPNAATFHAPFSTPRPSRDPSSSVRCNWARNQWPKQKNNNNHKNRKENNRQHRGEAQQSPSLHSPQSSQQFGDGQTLCGRSICRSLT